MTTPLRFNVCAHDGRIIDSFTEAELSTDGTEKTWHEAVCWAYVAWDTDRARLESISKSCGQ